MAITFSVLHNPIPRYLFVVAEGGCLATEDEEIDLRLYRL